MKLVVIVLLALGVCILALLYAHGFLGVGQSHDVSPYAKSESIPVTASGNPTDESANHDSLSTNVADGVHKAVENSAQNKGSTSGTSGVMTDGTFQESAFLKTLAEESLTESAFNLFDAGELHRVLNSHSAALSSPSTVSPDFIENMLCTRRMAKAVREVLAAADNGKTSEATNAILDAMDRLIEQRKELDAWLRDNPSDLNLTPQPSDAYRHEKLPALNIGGIQNAIASDAYLLGLLKDTDALATLVMVADHSVPLSEISDPSWPDQSEFPLTEYAGKTTIADAMDRILMHAAEQTLNPGAGEIVREYAEWRAERGLPEREKVVVYPYDAVTHDSIAGITEDGTKIPAIAVTAPLRPAGYFKGQNFFSVDQMSLPSFPPPPSDAVPLPEFSTEEHSEWGLTREDIKYIVESSRHLISLL